MEGRKLEVEMVPINRMELMLYNKTLDHIQVNSKLRELKIIHVVFLITDLEVFNNYINKIQHLVLIIISNLYTISNNNSSIQPWTNKSCSILLV